MNLTVEFDDGFFAADAPSRRCPGFCGRPNGSALNATATDGLVVCQPAVNSPISACEPCTLPLSTYDYAFLVFHALVPWLVHVLFLRLVDDRHTVSSQRKRLWLSLQTLSAGLESILAVLLAFVLFEPRGFLQLAGCVTPVGGGLRAWYSPFIEPAVVESPARLLRCASEVVYPLYSLPFVILAFCLINAVIFRSFLYALARYGFGVRLATAPLYATLWALPLCAVAHAVLSGLLYYAFPYICVVAALTLNAVHLATLCSDSHFRQPTARQICALLAAHGRRVEHAALLSAHAALLAFGGASALFNSSTFGWPAIAVLAGSLFVPTVFYVLTAGLSAPPIRGPARRR